MIGSKLLIKVTQRLQRDINRQKVWIKIRRIEYIVCEHLKLHFGRKGD